ncbi:hypothetical protein ABK040_004117 [Willaertia magna]
MNEVNSSTNKLLSFDSFKENFSEPKLLYQHDIIQVFSYLEQQGNKSTTNNNTTVVNKQQVIVFVHHGTLLQTGKLFKKMMDNNKLMPNVITYDEAYKDEEEYDASYYLICRDNNVINSYLNNNIKTLNDLLLNNSYNDLLLNFNFLKTLFLDISNGIKQLHRCDLTHNYLNSTSILLINNKNFNGNQKDVLQKTAILQFPGIGISYFVHVGTDYNYAPEIVHHSEFSKENDIFMFGLLVLKILILKDINVHNKYFNWNLDVLKPITNRFKDKVNNLFMISLLKVIKDCISSNINQRPTIDQIVLNLIDLKEEDLSIRKSYSINSSIHNHLILNDFGNARINSTSNTPNTSPLLNGSSSSNNNNSSYYYSSSSNINNNNNNSITVGIKSIRNSPSLYNVHLTTPSSNNLVDNNISDNIKLQHRHTLDIPTRHDNLTFDDDDDDDEDEGDDMFDKRRSRSVYKQMNVSLRNRLTELNPETTNENHHFPEHESFFHKLFSCFCIKTHDTLIDDSNRIDLFNPNVSTTLQELQTNDLPEYLIEGKKKRESLFCEKLVKRGPTSSVILVKDEKTRNNLVMKKCSPGNEELFTKEIKILKQLDHCRISKYIDDFEYTDDDQYIDHVFKYIVLKYCSNGDLEECFLKKKPKLILGPVLLMKIFLQTLEGLAYLHERGFVHCNISPSNLLLNESKDIVISDFTNCLRKDEKIIFIANKNYNSSDQVIGANANPLFDIYSLGNVILELLLKERIDCKFLSLTNTSISDLIQSILINYITPYSCLLLKPNNEKNIIEVLEDCIQKPKPATTIIPDVQKILENSAAICLQKVFRGYKVRKVTKLPKRKEKSLVNHPNTSKSISRSKTLQFAVPNSNISKSKTLDIIASRNRNN